MTAVSIARLLPPEAVAVPLQARTRGSVIDEMAGLAAQTGLLWDPQKMAHALREREELHPTALDNGVALLHPRRPLASILAEAFLALGRTCQGIPFGGERGGLTDVLLPGLLGRRTGPSADPGPAQPAAQRSHLPDRRSPGGGRGGLACLDRPAGAGFIWLKR